MGAFEGLPIGGESRSTKELAEDLNVDEALLGARRTFIPQYLPVS